MANKPTPIPDWFVDQQVNSMLEGHIDSWDEVDRSAYAAKTPQSELKQKMLSVTVGAKRDLQNYFRALAHEAAPVKGRKGTITPQIHSEDLETVDQIFGMWGLPPISSLDGKARIEALDSIIDSMDNDDPEGIVISRGTDGVRVQYNPDDVGELSEVETPFSRLKNLATDVLSGSPTGELQKLIGGFGFNVGGEEEVMPGTQQMHAGWDKIAAPTVVAAGVWSSMKGIGSKMKSGVKKFKDARAAKAAAKAAKNAEAAATIPEGSGSVANKTGFWTKMSGLGNAATGAAMGLQAVLMGKEVFFGSSSDRAYNESLNMQQRSEINNAKNFAALQAQLQSLSPFVNPQNLKDETGRMAAIATLAGTQSDPSREATDAFEVLALKSLIESREMYSRMDNEYRFGKLGATMAGQLLRDIDDYSGPNGMIPLPEGGTIPNDDHVLAALSGAYGREYNPLGPEVTPNRERSSIPQLMQRERDASDQEMDFLLGQQQAEQARQMKKQQMMMGGGGMPQDPNMAGGGAEQAMPPAPDEGQ